MQHLPQLSKPQAPVLALWRVARVLARACALSAVRHLLAKGLKRQEQTVRPQRRAWYDAPSRQRGAKRPALHVETCVPVVLGWGGRWWQGTPLALAIDATALGARCVGLGGRVVERGCALPVAGVVLAAKTTHAWRRAGRRRRRLRPAVPRHWTVLVLTARGLYAPWRLRRVVRLGWQPFVRINTGGSVRPTGATCWRPLASFAPCPGTSWRGAGSALTRHQVSCTWRARWEDGYKDPGLILTDLPPEAREAGWYGLRAWIDPGFQITQRAGGQGHRPRRTDPARAARLWLAVAAATLWLLRVGGDADETMPASTLLDVTARCPERPRSRRATRLRWVSVLRQGWVELWGALLRQEPLPQGRFVPEPWPAVPMWEDAGCEPAMALPEAA